ncbi:MAG: hypothetical protein J2P19_07435 [Pseudonocardia sp.]|nr:hypothetical protein [Pseudonocardia sp.]
MSSPLDSWPLIRAATCPSQAVRSSRPMVVALDLALDSIEARRARSDRTPEAAS